MNRIRQLIAAFRAWMQANAEAHAKAPERPCCSAPPPGAGKRKP
jgi:hypothetical protein